MSKTVRIYRPAKTAMQSGRAKTEKWVLEFASQDKKTNDPLMGWVASGDTLEQVKLKFDTKEAALAYAKKNGYTVSLKEPKIRTAQPKSYAANFAFDKVS